MSDETEVKMVKVILEVTAGLIPGQPMEQYTRRWAFSSEDIERDDWDVTDAHGAAMDYARGMMNPSRVNWVRVDWIWT